MAREPTQTAYMMRRSALESLLTPNHHRSTKMGAITWQTSLVGEGICLQNYPCIPGSMQERQGCTRPREISTGASIPNRQQAVEGAFQGPQASSAQVGCRRRVGQDVSNETWQASLQERCCCEGDRHGLSVHLGTEVSGHHILWTLDLHFHMGGQRRTGDCGNRGLHLSGGSI